MGLLDSIIGSVLGGSGGGSGGALSTILQSVLGGGGGLSGFLEKMNQAGLGQVANSWVNNGPNQPIQPHQLGQVFGQDQIDQWSQQTGLPHDTLLNQLSQILPHAVDQATPNGEVPQGGSSPFDDAGFEMPRR